MADRMETVITHLQIIHTWAEFARERDLQFFTAKHLEDIAQWSADAIVMIEEQKQMYFTLEHDWKMIKELLKEQKAVKPILTPWKENDDGEVNVYRMECGKCGSQFYYEDQKYCSECGTPILWEGR